MPKILIPALSIIIAIAIFMFMVIPTFKEARTIKGEANDFEEAVAKASEFNVELGQLITQKNSFSARELERLETLVPDSIDVIQTAIDLEELATKQGLLFGDITLTPTPTDTDREAEGKLTAPTALDIDKDDFMTSEIGFTVTGEYIQMKTFLASVEKSLVMMDVASLSFAAGEDDLIEYRFTIRIYALKSEF